MTAWARNRPVGDTEFLHASPRDRNGGLWIALRDHRCPMNSIAFYFEVDGTCSGFRVEPMRIADGGPTVVAGQLTARLLRSIPFAELEQTARGHAREMAASEAREAGAQLSLVDEHGDILEVIALVDGAGPGSDAEAEAQHRTDALVDRRSTGGRKPEHDDLFFAKQAQRYDRAMKSPNPIRMVAAGSNYSATSARNHISEARARGLLTPTTPGRAGGELTPKAIALLKEDES